MDPELKDYLDKFNQRFDEQARQTTEFMEFVRDNVATKSDLREINLQLEAVAEKVGVVRSELQEIRREVAGLNERMDNLERMVKEDVDMAVREVVELRGRLEQVESQLAKLSPAKL